MWMSALLLLSTISVILAIAKTGLCDTGKEDCKFAKENRYTSTNEKCSDADGVALRLADIKTKTSGDKPDEHKLWNSDSEVPSEASSIKVIKDEAALNGKQRFLADGLAMTSECDAMMHLAKVGGIPGDGYGGDVSPHTNSEIFEGVTVDRAALLAYYGDIEVTTLEAYLHLSELGRSFVEKYFQLNSTLYFTYTHLACRTAKKNMKGEAGKLSHAIHSDNCILREGRQCDYERPAYTWRNYSAIIYLNDDFEGGEFIFASDSSANKIESKVSPKCGRLVGFHNGVHNLHGVLPVSSGRRCALGLWFTLDVTYQEHKHLQARQMLLQLQSKSVVSQELLQQLED